MFCCLQVVITNVRLPKQSTVGDVLNEIKGKVWSSIISIFKREVLNVKGRQYLCNFLVIPVDERNSVFFSGIILFCIAAIPIVLITKAL